VLAQKKTASAEQATWSHPTLTQSALQSTDKRFLLAPKTLLPAKNVAG